MKGIRLYTTTAVVALLSGMAPMAHAQDDGDSGPALEEIRVTGSLIQRSNYQISSPIDTVDRQELEDRAPLNIAEFIHDLPYNFGSAFASGRAFGNERGAGTINLRGLGASATLVLINGRRQTQLPDAEDNIVDVNSLVPEIMLERIEILKDGASATYGSDAIAGVANFITRDDYEGFSMTGRYNRFTYSDADDYRIETLWGAGVGDRTHLVAAFSMSRQDAINGYAFTTPGQDPASALESRFSSSSSAPGEFVVPTRNAAGVISGQRGNVVDPECGNVVSSIPTAGRDVVADASLATDCRYNFWADNGSQSAIRRYQGMVRATSDITDRIHFDGEFGYAYVESRTPYTAGETLGESVTIPGTNPGNTYYRAMDANGNPLYAVSSGVSAGYERDGQEVFIPQRDVSGNVMLTGDPTNSASGIPFYEDILYSGRLVNSQGNMPTNNSYGPGEYAWSRPSISKNHIMRAAGGLTADLGASWSARGNLAYSRYNLSSNGTVGLGLSNELAFALQGLGGISCDRDGGTPGQGGCDYFNPFGNSVFATAGSANANSDDVLSYVFPMLKDEYESSLLATDLVASGELFDLPGGPVAIAVGFQNRRQTLQVDYDISANTNNRTNGVVAQDLNESRSTNAVFMEGNVPIFQNDLGYMELNAALRHEWIGSDLETTDPKIGFIFSSNDDFLTLRGTYGTSFIAPSLFRLHAVSARGTAVNDCAVADGPPCTGEQNLRVLLYQNGNTDLRPETSTAWSGGATIKPAKGLTFDATYWKFSFDDKIATQSATSIIAEGPYGTPENPVVRDPTDRIVSVTTRFFNQASVKTDGIDFGADYFTNVGDMGTLDLNLSGTYVFNYKVQDVPGGPVYDGAGATNDRRSAPPQADLRINTRATWHYGPHTLTAMLRYYGSVEFTLDPTISIGAYKPLDLVYTYNLDIAGTESQISLGSVNVLGAKAPEVPFPGFQPFIPTLHDTRGRSVWIKASVSY